jgi:hypothetical protein
MTRMPGGSRGHADKAAVSAAEPAGSLRENELAAYCPDLDDWPSTWRYEQRDVAPGQKLVECFKPFLCHLLSLDLSRKTLRRHRDNLWLLGGELIRGLHEKPRFRRRPIDQLVLEAVDEEGGPLIRRGTEEEQRSFDATCRKLHRFLQEHNSSSP